MSSPGVYLPTEDPNTYLSTELANAGWYEEGQHGGAVAALITGHVERLPTLERMEIARLTLEMFRVVPLVPLTLASRIIREGKRIQTVEVLVTDPSGQMLSMALVQRLRTADRPVPDEARPPLNTLPPPEECPPASFWGHGEAGKVMFHRDAIEIRQIRGALADRGPGAIWIRLIEPIVAGETPTPAQRGALTADFSNGVSRALDDDWVFMNSDLTVSLARHPVGEWVALEAVSVYHDRGRGLATAKLWDQSHQIGRSTQTLFLDRIS